LSETHQQHGQNAEFVTVKRLYVDKLGSLCNVLSQLVSLIQYTSLCCCRYVANVYHWLLL